MHWHALCAATRPFLSAQQFRTQDTVNESETTKRYDINLYLV
jgi:hypothetical protein